MARVYGLKHATPKMKYQHMRMVMDWKADLNESQDAEAERRAALKDQFADALAKLKAADPQGWEAWYDDDQNVPNWNNWGQCGPAIEAIQKRVAEVKAVQIEQLTLDGGQFNWRVASANTLRGYAAAAKDFETATGSRVDRADSASMQKWHDGMKRRGLASNTIRTRIAAVRILSGVQYPLPPKEKAENRRQKTESRTLTLEQVQAVLKQAQGEERSALMLALTVGLDMRMSRNTDDFRAYFLGAGRQMTAQSLTRLIKRCAGKAGLDESLVSLRTWTRSGAALLQALNPSEFVQALPQAELPEGVDWSKRLHGIGRRSKHLSKA